MEVVETLSGDVGVDLCSGEITVTEQKLNHPEVGPMVDQMSGEGVSQRMR